MTLFSVFLEIGHAVTVRKQKLFVFLDVLRQIISSLTSSRVSFDGEVRHDPDTKVPFGATCPAGVI